MGQLSVLLGNKLLEKAWILTTAESCTGGLVAKLVTDVAGSSQWFDRGFVTYSNDAKVQMLDVSPATLDEYGAVSLETVREMAEGAVANSNAHCSIAISGIAGPSGGTSEKPVGIVCFAWKIPNISVKVETQMFSGNRVEIRQNAALYGLKTLLDMI